ncbi:hypothetical protein JTE90_017053 [Oedothorax gibbosus]|uniref:DNA repair and recombination protein RAD54-like n=1 Tax=Oedothorax gibbosus TaxID=931172 RepID=A0AAV6UN86_9ARAC|nr:hypothetical protein JTE90_017053 [Oedothorax gibbosus]
MRRSAAPSCQSASKRMRFLSPFVNSSFELEENDIFSVPKSKCSNTSNELLSHKIEDATSTPSKDTANSSTLSNNEVLKYLLESTPEKENSFNKEDTSPEEKRNSTCKGKATDSVRSTDEILKYLFEPDADTNSNSEIKDNLPSNSFTSVPLNKQLIAANRKLTATFAKREEVPKYADNQEKDTTSCDPNVSYYNVLYCKRSSKKHKVWDSDGVLIINNRSATLKDSLGKIIDRGIGYKLKEIEAIEEGGKFFIGGKECEIQFQISPEEYLNLKNPEAPENDDSCSPPPKSSKKPSISAKYHPLKFQVPTLKEEISKLPEKELMLPQPSLEHQTVYNKENLPLTTVKIDKFLAKQLRPHQIEGIIFMYKCILGFQHEYGHGVILADEMGLGKTLQCIGLIWTLYKQGPYGGKPILKRVIILTPSSLVMNWKKEFNKWLGESRLSVYPVDKKHNVKEYLRVPRAVLIISYEQFLRSSELLSSISFDLVICDEGHRIKNINIKISSVVNCLSTTRRILLTGTPIQNDLSEYFSIVDFVNPGALGSLQSFRRNFEKPILLSQDQECSDEEKEIGQERSEELNQISSAVMLRRTQEVINQYLPSKSEIVVFCPPSEMQKRIYKLLLNTGAVWKFLAGGTTESSQHLIYISYLRKLCNHPALLYNSKEVEDGHILNCIQSTFPNPYFPSSCDSGKMKVLETILKSIFSQTKKETIFSRYKKEKIVIVSGFTKTLDIIEELCKSKGYLFLRLDGSTATSSRQDLVDVFNRSYTKYNIFLLSSKAGGVGLNLIGASRIVLYDIDWNPANDLQAMARIWRDGQKQSVFVYRLLTTGTIEEKIYQRQISKQCLSGSVLNPNSNEKLKFSKDELKDLFTLYEDTLCLTHDLINCQCLNEECNEVDTETSIAPENIGMEELMNWKHICGPIFEMNSPDFTLASCGSDISFLLVNSVNFSNQS